MSISPNPVSRPLNFETGSDYIFWKQGRLLTTLLSEKIERSFNNCGSFVLLGDDRTFPIYSVAFLQYELPVCGWENEFGFNWEGNCLFFTGNRRLEVVSTVLLEACSLNTEY